MGSKYKFGFRFGDLLNSNTFLKKLAMSVYLTYNERVFFG